MDLFGFCSTFLFIFLIGVPMCLMNYKVYDVYDLKNAQFGHKPRMKYMTKLSCGQVIARLWMESYGPFDSKFGKEEDGTYTLTIDSTTGRRDVRSRVKYKVLVTPEQEESAVYLFVLGYKADERALNIIALELKEFLEKKLEAVRVE